MEGGGWGGEEEMRGPNYRNLNVRQDSSLNLLLSAVSSDFIPCLPKSFTLNDVICF